MTKDHGRMLSQPFIVKSACPCKERQPVRLFQGASVPGPGGGGGMRPYVLLEAGARVPALGGGILEAVVEAQGAVVEGMADVPREAAGLAQGA